MESIEKAKPTTLISKLRSTAFAGYLSLFRAYFVNQGLGVVRGFIVAKYLGPADYGLMSSVRLISMLDKFGQLGLVPVVTREVAYKRGQGELGEVEKLKSTGYSAEIWLTLCLTFLGIASSFFFESFKTQIAIVIASSVLFFARIHSILGAETILNKKFKFYGNVVLVTGLLLSVLIIFGVPWGGVWWVLAVPAIQSMVAIRWLRTEVSLHFKWKIDTQELWRMLRVAIPLTLHSLAYGSYRYAERIVVLWYYTVYELGLVSLGMTAMNNLMTLSMVGARVRKIHIGELLGKKSYQEAHRCVLRESGLHVIISAAVVAVLWPLIGIVIPLLLPKYVDGVLLAQVLILSVVVRNISPYIQIVLVSPLLDKQGLLGPTQFICTGLFVGSCWLLNEADYMSLEGLIMLDVVFYTIYSLAFPFYYNRYFYQPFIKRAAPEGAQ